MRPGRSSNPCEQRHELRPGGFAPAPLARRGTGPGEVLVVIVVLGIVALLVMIGLSKSREAARSATCARNLQQIGLALGLYQQQALRLPRVGPLEGIDGPPAGPLAVMLEQLGAATLTGLDDRDAAAAPPGRRPPIAERVLPEFICPADPIATSGAFPAPVSYRANTGDRTDGRRGPFAPGSSITFDEVEAGHGASYTAAFAERLVGTAGRSNDRIRDYRVVPGPVPEAGCPEAPDAPLATDAGRSWLELSWRSTLYTHASPPRAPRSCIDARGRTALMGASSGHVEGVRVLLMDGGVRVYTATVEPAVWAALGSYSDDEAD